MAVETPLRWLSALVLVGVAVRMIVLGLRPQSSFDEPPDAPSPRSACATVFMITLVNPATVVYFAALVGGSTATIGGVPEAVAFVLAAGIASATWQLLLAGAGAGLGRVLTGPAARRWTAVVGRPSSWPSPAGRCTLPDPPGAPADRLRSTLRCRRGRDAGTDERRGRIIRPEAPGPRSCRTPAGRGRGGRPDR